MASKNPAPKFEAGLPKALFASRIPGGWSRSFFDYAVAADGKRFLINTVKEETASAPITVVLNWTAGLKR